MVRMYSKEAPDTLKAMFGAIAPGYDRANGLMSLGMHHLWNQALARHVLSQGSVQQLLDLCCGTGEIAFQCRRLDPLLQMTLVDFCPEMVALAQAKGRRLGWEGPCLVGDAHQLPLPDRSFDAVTCAYGLRNLHSPLIAAREVRRVLRPGGVWAILELTRPAHTVWRVLHRIYLKTLVPILGRIAAGDQAAYTYLPNSIEACSPPETWKALLKEAGFTPFLEKRLLGGIATLLIARTRP
jgi:demethylmenaquinone methyltransferase / 2-methoxy-6-polyprenyl-1,4-benzoquinol methylase